MSCARVVSALLAILLVALASGGCRDRSRLLNEYLTAASRAWGFRGAALVAYKGDIVLAEGYGPANELFDQPNTSQTKFFIGSITKQFTAAAVLKLYEQGRLDLNDLISVHLPDYPALASQHITIHDLLTHSSGLVNYTDIPEVNIHRTQAITPTELMRIIISQPLKFEPGTSFEYSNSGYIVLGSIIEAASGQSYEAYLHHEILKPSGMYNTGYARREAGHPGRADGYTVDSDWRPTEALPIDYSLLHTAGALYSTIVDMHRWETILCGQGALSEGSLASMFTDYGHGYGYGWAVDSLWGRRYASHGGFLDGFYSVVERWLDDSLLIVVFSNEDEAPVRKIARGLAAICLFGKPQVKPIEKTPTPIDASQLTRYEGVYRQEHGGRRYVWLENGAFWFQQPNRIRQRLYYAGGERFFMQSDNTVLLEFTENEMGHVTGYRLHNEGVILPATRVPDDGGAGFILPRLRLPVDPVLHDQFVGSYSLQSRLGECDSAVRLTISRDGEHMFAAVADFEQIEIFPISSHEFAHQTAGFRLIFDVDPDTGLIACRLSMGDQEVRGRKIQ